MKIINSYVLKLIIISGLVGLLCTYSLYAFCPRFLCYVVYDVRESDSALIENKTVEGNAQYTEYFKPVNSYIKSIYIHVKSAKAPEDTAERICGTLIDRNGKIVKESFYEIENAIRNLYCEFPIEKWVEDGQEYQFVITFPDCDDIEITFGPCEIGPDEHVRLLYNGEEIDENIFLRYSYGTYSKKLLAMWFLVFFISSYLLGESCIKRFRDRKAVTDNRK